MAAGGGSAGATGLTAALVWHIIRPSWAAIRRGEAGVRKYIRIESAPNA